MQLNSRRGTFCWLMRKVKDSSRNNLEQSEDDAPLWHGSDRRSPHKRAATAANVTKLKWRPTVVSCGTFGVRATTVPHAILRLVLS